ncbi:MAG: TonB-dependent receptor plug domain-containing protein [Pseudomonadota bacterium]
MFFVLAFFCFSVGADDSEKVESLSVFGQKESLPTRPGSAHILTEKDLRDFEVGDIHRILRSVPGVNIQEEDGFGLRPNIGLRGAHPHRSKKITIMEDGVLVTPAPYSAPAAYYFPIMDNISGVEVFKGMPSVAYGPNSIGGAINLLTKTNQEGIGAHIGIGSFGYQKYKLSAGFEAFGDWSIDATRIETTGFKELEGVDNTGFERSNFRVRWDKALAPLNQNITFKFNWAGEDSNETYVGLSDDDFAENPYRRYVSTREDKMLWNHRQYFLSYALSPSMESRLRATLYRNELDRSWDKLNGFYDNGTDPVIGLGEILNNPTFASNSSFYDIIRGNLDSSVLSNDRGVLDIGNNQRQYYSQGIQLNYEYELDGFSWLHLFDMSYRFHQDQVSRFHESRYFNMTSGQLVESPTLNQQTTLLNEGNTDAHTATFKYETQWEDLTLTGAARLEKIDYEQVTFTDPAAIETIVSEDEIFAPGFGAFYQAFDQLGFLFGVHKGFTPVGPGQDDAVSPEEALNYELGLRHTGSVGFEVIGFLSDYQNILGTCTQSSGCTINSLDERFNGGAAEIRGFEVLFSKDFYFGNISVPVKLNGTYTQTEFKNEFVSTVNEWGSGTVSPGDPIPYIPEVQGNLTMGLNWKPFRFGLNINYQGSMADQAVALDRRDIPERWVLDFNMAFQWTPSSAIKFRMDNVTDEKYAVSRRPAGVRPGRPQMFFLSFDYGF